MRRIKLTQNKYALVDNEDYEYLNQWKWQYGDGYAQKWFSIGYKKRKRIMMHRFIAKIPDGYETDHINGNTLDNRKENLRKCNRTENVRNKSVSKNNKLGIKGVRKWGDKYQVRLRIEGKTKSLGCYKTKEEAGKVYDKFAKQYYGEFARLNYQ